MNMRAGLGIAIVAGLLAGAAGVSALSPFFLPAISDEESALRSIQQSASVGVNGTIREVRDGTFVLETDEGYMEKRSRILVRYDGRTLVLARPQTKDAAGTLTEARLLVAPQEDIIRDGMHVRVNLWVTSTPQEAYAIGIVTPALQ